MCVCGCVCGVWVRVGACKAVQCCIPRSWNCLRCGFLTLLRLDVEVLGLVLVVVRSAARLRTITVAKLVVPQSDLRDARSDARVAHTSAYIAHALFSTFHENKTCKLNLPGLQPSQLCRCMHTACDGSAVCFQCTTTQ